MFEKLAKDAGILFEDGRDNRIHYIQTKTLQKFAELILLECCKVSNNPEDIKKRFNIE
jgi:hypothetical protein